MNDVRIKGFVKKNFVINFIAERILNGYTILRYWTKGKFTKDGEDKIVKEILQSKFNLKPKEIQYFDIGANDYRRGNNTYLFYKAGAKGILVEADTILCNLLKKRKRDIVFNSAVSNKKNAEALEFYICSLPTRSTLDKKQTQKWAEMGLEMVKVIKIPCITITEIIEQTNIIPDLMSIDIEGMDFRVIESIDFVKYPIKVIIAEENSEKNKDGKTMDEYMKEVGYGVADKTRANTIYYRNV